MTPKFRTNLGVISQYSSMPFFLGLEIVFSDLIDFKFLRAIM